MAPVSAYISDYPTPLLFDSEVAWGSWTLFQNNLPLLTMAWRDWCARIFLYIRLSVLP